MKKMEKRRLKLYREQNGKCIYCGLPLGGSTPKHATIDHVIPKTRGGANAYGNLVLTHPQCNMIKADFATPDEVDKYAETVKDFLARARMYGKGQIKNGESLKSPSYVRYNRSDN